MHKENTIYSDLISDIVKRNEENNKRQKKPAFLLTQLMRTPFFYVVCTYI